MHQFTSVDGMQPLLNTAKLADQHEPKNVIFNRKILITLMTVIVQID